MCKIVKTHISWVLDVVGKKLRVRGTNSCTCHIVLVKIEKGELNVCVRGHEVRDERRWERN